MSNELPAFITVEADRVILRGHLAREVVHDVLYGDDPETVKFNELFEIVTGPGGYWLAAEDYYQGISVTAVIKRKADNRLFGYPYWVDISKHGEAQADSNGDENGFPYEERCHLPDGLDEIYVWHPVEPFTITGYDIVPPAVGDQAQASEPVTASE